MSRIQAIATGEIDLPGGLDSVVVYEKNHLIKNNGPVHIAGNCFMSIHVLGGNIVFVLAGSVEKKAIGEANEVG